MQRRWSSMYNFVVLFINYYVYYNHRGVEGRSSHAYNILIFIRLFSVMQILEYKSENPFAELRVYVLI